ncbi:arylsulfatase [Arachidicoccus soli]|uniref:Arylsulfatase n=1 Tax=Arachidicoccus soli TaxID=2341117 RepID=A0A386HQQ4_9BACT|nr:arylsulfatase [Arachidicoccus soli]AYD47771.1 arylsulfatase [Arachidicoccus soli]
MLKDRKYWILSVLFMLIISLISSYKLPSHKKKDNRPNIIVILADDMGFSDPGCFGGEIHTPNINWLAANGVRFTNFYNTSRCCPTRASLLTGLYNQQAGIGEMTTDQHEPGYRGFLTDNTVTIAEVLKAAGYQTAMSGKWHVSNTVTQPTKKEQLAWLNHQAFHPLFSPLDQYPIKRGFDKFYGTIWGVVDYFDPFSLVHDSTAVKTVPKNYYHTDAINDTAASFIHQMSKKDKPFFMYVAENASHWPLMAKPQDIAKYKNTYKKGWEAIREARYKRMVEMGLIDPKKAPLSPRWKDDLKWKNNPDSIWDAETMSVHAAMIDCLDQGVGRIIKALRETGQLDNTIILFLSDNGASAEIAANYGPGFDRPSETRDGRKIMYDTKKQYTPGVETTYSSIGPRWANVSNTPYEYWKSISYEGGIHTPMIAFWPKGLKLKKGSFDAHLGHVMDFMATFVDLAHAKYPKEFKGHAITPMQGISLAPIFAGKKGAKHEALFNEHFGSGYVRYEGWKLVKRSQDKKWHLFHIDDDETEMNDLAAKYPEKVKDMDRMWQKWAHQVHVFPKP